MLLIIRLLGAMLGALLLPLVAFAQTSAPSVPAETAASASARAVLASSRHAVIQIKGFFGANTAQAFHGTGFAVAPGGLFMTNFHVVAEQVQYPSKYRLEYRTPEGATGAITVLGVDVRHDLALVRAEGYAPEPLHLATTPPAMGERAYSIGFPLDVGLTITEGVSNGKVADSFEARIHYSGAINPGMSGGPALDSSGTVIGVNVAGYRFQQLVSFLVPIEHAIALRAGALASHPSNSDLKADILAQVKAHSAALLDALPAAIPTLTLSGYALPDRLAPFIDCSATGSPSTTDPVEQVNIECRAKAGLYLGSTLSSGDLKYTHVVLSTSKLDAWRFSNRLSAVSNATGIGGTKRNVAPFACQDHVVALKGFDAGLLVCSRAYRKLAGLYDFVVRVTSLNARHRGFASHLDLFGVEFDSGMRFVKRYVEAMEVKP